MMKHHHKTLMKHKCYVLMGGDRSGAGVISVLVNNRFNPGHVTMKKRLCIPDVEGLVRFKFLYCQLREFICITCQYYDVISTAVARQQTTLRGVHDDLWRVQPLPRFYLFPSSTFLLSSILFKPLPPIHTPHSDTTSWSILCTF